MKKHIVDCKTGVEQEIDLTSDEMTLHNNDLAKYNADLQAQQTADVNRKKALDALTALKSNSDPNIAALATAVQAIHGT